MAKSDYSIIFHTHERISREVIRELQIGVEFNVTENTDQIFKRIKRKMGIIYPGDWVEIRFNHIDDPQQS